MTPEILANLKVLAPSIAFSDSRSEDKSFNWDDDDRDLRRKGYVPCDVTVTAKAITNGELFEGRVHLGGSYYKPSEPLGDIHGYLPQMLEEAAIELREFAKTRFELGHAAGVVQQADIAIDYLRRVVRDRYNAQRVKHRS